LIDFRKLARKAAEIIRLKKGKNILILDVRMLSDFTDYLVLANGTSDTHIKTILNEIDEQLNINAYRKDIKSKANWVVLDYGGVVVHIFSESARKYYNLENNWAKAKEVKIKKGSRQYTVHSKQLKPKR